MGTRRVGLNRVKALIENLKRSLDWNGASLSGVASLSTTGAVTSGTTLTATSGVTGGALKLDDGGAVAQGDGSGKATAVTLNKIVGKITMDDAELTAGSTVTFTVTCSHARATDVVVINHHSGGTVGSYHVQATGHAAGSFKVTVTNVTSGALSQQPVLHYALVKTAHS
jgi:hypothetical protein